VRRSHAPSRAASALVVTTAFCGSVAVAGGVTLAAASCHDGEGHATTVTVTLADDGEPLAVERHARVGEDRCAVDADDGLPVAVAVLHRDEAGRSLEANELGDAAGTVATTITVRDTTATSTQVPVEGPEGDEHATVRLGVPQLVRVTVGYPRSWEVTSPGETGTSVHATADGIEISRVALVFPPLTDDAVRLQVAALPGPGTPAIRVESTPAGEDTPLDPDSALLDRDTAAVLGALSELAADGAVQLVDGIEELAAGTDDLTDGADELADGADDLADGSDELAAGAGQLAAGTFKLADGLGELADGAGQLGAGLDQYAAGGRALAAGGGQLADGAAALAAGVPELAAGARAVADGTEQLATQLGLAADGAAELADGGVELAAGARQLADGTAELAAQATAARDALAGSISTDPVPSELLALLPPELAADVEEATAAIAPLLGFLDEAIVGSTELVDGAAALAAGTAALADGNAELAAGLSEAATGGRGLAVGADSVADGTAQLSDGAAELAAGSAGLADGLDAYAAGGDELAAAGSQLAGGASGAADGGRELAAATSALAGGVGQFADGAGQLAGGVDQLADGAGQLAGGAGQLADGAAELPGAVREIAATADRANQRTATTQAVLEAGATRARALAGDADTISYELVHDGDRPWPLAVWVALAAVLAAAAGGAWWWQRARDRDRAAADAARTEGAVA
jgi:X-X-X-Leu-X-X-Gly heptad repeat protein